MRHPRTAFWLLVAGMVFSYSWYLAPPEFDALAWNITTAALVVYLLVQLGLVFASPEVWAVVALLAAFKLLVIGCSAWYAVDPWPMRPGQELCSARLNWPLGIIGLVFALGFLSYFTSRSPKNG